MRSRLTTCLLLFGLTGLLVAAPAPFPRPAKPVPAFGAKDMAGEWQLVWDGEPCTAGFSATGSFWCVFMGELWLGQWRFDEKGRIEVTESPVGGAATLRWSVEATLDRRHIHGKAVMDHGEVDLDMKKSKP
jgi:hypothetical protein